MEGAMSPLRSIIQGFRVSSALLAAVLALAAAGVAWAQDFSAANSEPQVMRGKALTIAKLHGDCTWQSASIKTERGGGGVGAATMLARASFDGQGDVVLANARTNFDGVEVDQSYHGTYTINPGGDGEITFNFANPERQLVYAFQFSRKRRVLRFMRVQDQAPVPVGSTSMEVTVNRLSIGACYFDE
jgi:hypothetical protein